MAMDTNLVFLCGFPSSGTDLIKNIVNAHTDVFISGEFPFLPSLASKYGPIVPGETIDKAINDLRRIDIYRNFQNPNIALQKSNREYFLSEIYSIMLNGKQYKWKGNKTPQNTENIDKIKILFPKAKFILIVRDVRDICLSWENKWGKDKLLCAYKWDMRMQRGVEKLKNLENDSFLVLKFEELLDNLESEVRNICHFLDIRYQERMLEFDKYVLNGIEGKINYGRNIIRNNKEKWKAKISDKEIRRIEEVSFSTLEMFGYHITIAYKKVPIKIFEKYRGLFHDIISLIFIGNRAIKNNKLRSRFNSIIFQFKKRLFYTQP
jgi:hypothetical protein